MANHVYMDMEAFSHIPTISSEGDRLAWLAIQASVASVIPSYCYLEIGSFLGGSLQQYYTDPKCTKIYSIDKRPKLNPDNREIEIKYCDNTQEIMISNLAKISNERIGIVECFGGDVSDIDKEMIKSKPAICFIDGEHTDKAVVNDFDFVFSVADKNAVIYFHDSPIVYKGIIKVIKKLSESKRKFELYKMTGSTFAILLDDCSIGKCYEFTNCSKSGNVFLWAMRVNGMLNFVLPRFVLKCIKSIGKWYYG